MKQYLVIYSETMQPAGIYESNSPQVDGYICDKEVIHAELPLEGWTSAPFEIVLNQDGSKLLQYLE